MDIRPIKTEADYDWALAEIARYFDHEPERGTADADRFDVLADLIEAYEARHWPIEAPDPIDMIEYRMEQLGLEQKDLAVMLNSRSAASELLHRRRPLTINIIRKLVDTWGLPADVLIRPYHIEGRSEQTAEQA